MSKKKNRRYGDNAKARIWCTLIENIAPIIRAIAKVVSAVAVLMYVLLH